MLGAFGAVSNIGGRVLYRFMLEDAYSLYGFGSVGLWNARYGWAGARARESVIGFGGGAGVELDWQQILSPADGSFPPLYSSLDLGLILANFQHYNFSGLGIGVGLHYRF